MICFSFFEGTILNKQQKRLFKDDFLKRQAKYIHIHFKNKFKKILMIKLTCGMKTDKAVKTFWKKVYQQIFQTD